MKRYVLQKSKEIQNGYVLTDTHFKIVVTWVKGKFNESQDFIKLEDCCEKHPLTLALIAREMTDFLISHHRELL